MKVYQPCIVKADTTVPLFVDMFRSSRGRNLSRHVRLRMGENDVANSQMAGHCEFN